MPIPLGTLLNNLATKFSVDVTTPEFVALLSINAEVPDSIAAAFNKELITEEAAMSNFKIKNAFTAKALDGVDASINLLLDQMEFPEEEKAQIKGIRSTYDKIPAMLTKVRELEGKKAGASTGDKAALQQQINALQADISAKIQAKDEEAKNIKLSYEGQFKDLILERKLASRKLDTSKFSAEAMEKLALQFLSTELQAKGLTIVNENKNLRIKQLSDPSLDYYENNQPVTVDSFLDQVLANNKLLAVNDQSSATGDTGFQRNTPPPNGQQGQPRPLSGMLSSIDQAMADYARGSGG